MSGNSRPFALAAFAVAAALTSGGARAAPLLPFFDPYLGYDQHQFAPQPPLRQARPSDEFDDETTQLPARLRRQIVNYPSQETPGIVIIDTPNTYLYYVLGNGKAIRYGIGVGREGFTWSGVKTITRKMEWPDWHPPQAMIARQPYLPRFVAGGPGNPLGARAMYLGDSEYRIHGTNDPATIGRQVSSGCIRLTNEDVIDLFKRVKTGAKVIVLPQTREARMRAHDAMRRTSLPGDGADAYGAASNNGRPMQRLWIAVDSIRAQ